MLTARPGFWHFRGKAIGLLWGNLMRGQGGHFQGHQGHQLHKLYYSIEWMFLGKNVVAELQTVYAASICCIK